MEDWLRNPTVLIVGGIGLVAAFVLLRNQSSASSTTTQNTTTTPVGQSYQYLDGSGVQHLIATDPNGALTYYQNVPPQFQSPQQGELSSYVGMMGMGTPTYTNTTPYYSMLPVPYAYQP